ncbi:unnamed protein product [Rhizophagus irregularis]|nr:unnamed protein product [Rhizophagus irregularis]
MLPGDEISNYLKKFDKPPSLIHIIVQPPQPATTNAPKIKGISRLGGLGGTKMKKKEDGLGYEGLDLTHIDNICQRKSTIKRLLYDLFKKRIILVRSPPMAGKTSLAQLLEYNILQSDEAKKGFRCVFRISLMWMVKRGMEWTFTEGFKALMGMEWGEFIQLCRDSDTDVVLIVDEVQLIYKPQNESEPRNGGNIFWETFKEVNQYLSNLHIVAFASYGHYGVYTVHGDHSIMDISPPSILHKDNTWGFADVRFTEEEFSDYFNKFCEMHLQMLKKDDIPFLHNYVREITAFHPGLVAFTMDEIIRRFVKQPHKLEFGDIFAYLKSYNFYSHLKGIRATPQVNDMSSEEKMIIDKVLFKKGLKIQTNGIPCNGRIIKTNVLVDKIGRSVLDFPAPLLRATYLQDRFGYVVRSESPPKTFKDFIKSVFTNMNPKILQNSKGKGKDGQLFECVWQMEFYRALLQVLPEDIYPSVDVGKVFGSKGYVDFYVNDKRHWAIELLRDEVKLNEHQQRFQRGGTYVPILKHTKQWAIIDIRNSKMKAPESEKRKRNDIYVICGKNFESVQLIYPNGNKEDIRLLGEENLLGYDLSEFLDDQYDQVDKMEIDS